MDSEPRINRSSKCGAKGVQVDQWVRRNSVERQSPSRTVNIHRDSIGDRGRAKSKHFTVVSYRVSVVLRVWQSPGLFISKLHCSPFNSFVTQCYGNISIKLHLPVTATSHSRFTQQLAPRLKPVRMIIITLHLWKVCIVADSPVVVRQYEASVHRVHIHFKFTQIWNKQRQLGDWLVTETLSYRVPVNH